MPSSSSSTGIQATAAAAAGASAVFEVTGVVAHSRIKPLLPKDWVDVTPTSTSTSSQAVTTRTGGRRGSSAILTEGDATTTSSSFSSRGSRNDVGRQGDDDGNQETTSSPVTLTTTTTTSASTTPVPDFLWENTPRRHTKDVRDFVTVYSHLPNGQSILDSKWVLGRLFSTSSSNSRRSHDVVRDNVTVDDEYESLLLATCETHCFCGLDGFESFARRMKLLKKQDLQEYSQLPDILSGRKDNLPPSSSPSPPSLSAAPNLWVVKDAAANGAGGIWVVGPTNAGRFCKIDTSPLYPQHKYVAQKYVWPPLLYGGKKFHVRVYATITYDGRAFVHRRAFLHVANEPFNVTTSGRGGEEMYDDTVHITNCCANSHDDRKFAGEILADFEESEFTSRQEEESATTAPVQAVVPLAEFFPSVKATVSEVARRAFPFLDGGQKNNGFEYCGLDFILSYKSVTAVACGNNKIKTTDCRDGVIPVAYLLEINAPPSQDTATGLLHAENLHNQVLKDWIDYWVVPRVTNKNLASSNTKAMDTAPLGGWRCVYEPTTTTSSNDADSCMDSDPILPSKAAILNKIRWALFEKKMSKIDLENMATEEEGNIQHEQQRNGTRQCKLNASIVAEKVSQFARTQFPFFTFSEPQSLQARQKLASRTNSTVFFESAGGSQVSQAVIDSMNSSLCFRHRSVVGSATKTMARKTAKILFGALQSSVVFGANATSLFSALAQTYLRYNLLSSNDEVVVSTENHRANFDPWTEAAARVGATIKYWTPNAKFCPSSTNRNDNSSADLDDLITTRTRIVAISHVSNILGLINPIAKWTEKIKSRSSGRAHVVVDGVAAVPHVFAAFDNLGVDWYVVSMHKMFGPHLGILLAAKGRAMDQVVASSGNSPGDNDTCLSSLLESGTSNLEGCAGVLGVAAYLNRLAESENGLLAKHWSTVNMSGCVTSTGEGNCHNAIDLGNDIARMLTTETVKAAYRLIRTAEIPIVDALFCGLSRSKNVRILGRAPSSMKSSSQKVPTFSFVHDTIPSRQIVMFCEERGIMCRHGYFLCTERLAGELHIITSCSNNTNTTKNASKSDDDGVVRFSLVHYNTVSEVEYALSIIESMPGW